VTRAPALLLVAHGSRDPRHAATVRALCATVRAARPGVRVETGFLDHCAPGVGQAVDRLAAEGVREVVAVPLLLTRAFHARTDIPAALRTAAARHAGLTVRQAGVLGPSALLVRGLERRLAEAGVRDRAATGLVLAAAGSSDPRALAGLEDLAREWQREGGWRAVRPAYASAATPRTADAVRGLRADGVRDVAVAPYVLAPGLLPDRIAGEAADAGATWLAAPLGAAPEVAGVLLRRYDERAAAGGAPLR
jgi:sirohydrochlorin ferrochelatase